MTITNAAHSEAQDRHHDTIISTCTPTELDHLNHLLRAGAVTVYELPEHGFSHKVRAIEPASRNVATHSTYLVSLDWSPEEAERYAVCTDICEYLQFYGAETPTAHDRDYAHTKYVVWTYRRVTRDSAGQRGYDTRLSEEEFAAMWQFLLLYWTNTVELARDWKAAYNTAQAAWEEFAGY